MAGQEIEDRRLSLILKILVCLCGLGLIGIAIHRFATFEIENPVHFFLAIYYILFGALLVLCEMPINWILRHFSFLGYYIGRGIFLLFLGTLIFDIRFWWYVMIACFMFLTAVIYILLGVACKGKISQQEDVIELHSRRFGNTEEIKEPPLVLNIPMRPSTIQARNPQGFSLPPPLEESRP